MCPSSVAHTSSMNRCAVTSASSRVHFSKFTRRKVVLGGVARAKRIDVHCSGVYPEDSRSSTSAESVIGGSMLFVIAIMFIGERSVKWVMLKNSTTDVALVRVAVAPRIIL